MSQSLPVELDALVWRGLSREEPAEAVLIDVAIAAHRGDVTTPQAAAFCALLGYGQGDLRAALARTRGSN